MGFATLYPSYVACSRFVWTVPNVGTSWLAVGFASKLAPTGQFFGIEHVLIPPKLTLVNGYFICTPDELLGADDE